MSKETHTTPAPFLKELDPEFQCARISLVLSAGEIPALARVKPAHQESSLGLIEVTI